MDDSGEVSAITDALYLLRYAFARGDAPPCMDAADADDNDTVSALFDAQYLLFYAFADGPEPPDPGVDECGGDPTEYELGCATEPEECE